jgi:phage terminase large subunit-like protein
MPRHTKPHAAPTTSRGSRQPERSLDKNCVEHFERFCRTLKLTDTLKPFVLEPWQILMLDDYFTHGALEHLWELPTGQGKSTLLGAIVLHHGTYVRVNPNVIVLGGLGGHAKHTLNAAAWFISQSPMLQNWWIAQEYGMGRIKSLIHEDSHGQIVASSAGRRVGGKGGTSQEGEAPSLVVVEELHRHEDNGSAVRTLTTKVQKRSTVGHEVKIVHATTAGDSLNSPLGRMEKRATAESSKVTEPIPGRYYTRAEDADGDLVMHRWALPQEIDLPDAGCTAEELSDFLDQVIRANPATFITKNNLRRSWKANASEPWVFARQHCNQWVVQNDTAFSRFDIAAGAKPGVVIPQGAEGVVIGVDTSTSRDTTALVPVWISTITGRMTCSGSVVLKPERDHKIRIRTTLEILEMMRQRWPTMKLAFDRNYGGGWLAETFEEDHGLTVVDHNQGQAMEVASMLLGELIAQHELDHDGAEDLVSHLQEAGYRETAHGRRWRLVKAASGEKMDAAVALAMAAHVAWDLAQEAEMTSINPDDYRIQGL